MSLPSVRPSRVARAALVLAVVVPVLGLVSTTMAAADPPEFVTADGPHLVTAEYEFTGAEQAFEVPDGVTEIEIDAVGAPGGVVDPEAADPTAAGGRAARVTGTVSVDPGQVLRVRVGGAGGVGARYVGEGAGGWNGGGHGGNGSSSSGSGGGGATDVRTCPAGSGDCDSLASRLVVAAGGGGSGSIFCGGCTDANGPLAGGDAGAAGTGTDSIRGPVTGGQPGTADAGGAGGVAASGERIVDGEAGTFGSGADNSSSSGFFGGGGGGGGWYGGGSGAVNQYYGAGGGGGSSLIPGGGSSALVDRNVPPSLSITYDAGPVTDVSVETADSMVATGQDSTVVTATATAAGGEPIAGLEVSFASTDPGQTFGPVTDNGDGTYTATLAGTATVGSATVTATAAGSTPEEDVAGTGEIETENYSITVEPLPTVLVATGSDAMLVTASAETSSGAPVQGLELTFSSTDPDQDLGEVTDEEDGTYTASLQGSATAGTAAITAVVTDAGDPDIVGAEVVTEGYSVTVAPVDQKLVATGHDSVTVTASAESESGIELDGLDLAFESDDPGHSFGEVTDEEDGTYTATLHGSATAGTAAITAVVTDAGDPDVVEAEVVTEGYTVTVQPIAEHLLASGVATRTVTARAQSETGTPVSGLDLAFASTDPGQSFGAVTDHEDGTYTATLTGSTTPGTATISAVVTGAGSPTIVSAALQSDAYVKPTIRVAVSAAKPAKNQWYRTPVTLSFTCAGTLQLTAGCPAPVVLTREGRGQQILRTVTDILGNSATVTAGPVNIDRTKPKLKVTGARKGATYGGVRKVKCKATDALSGIRSCKVVTKKAKTRKGTKVSWTATAVDRAGNTRTAKGQYRIAKRR